MKANTSNSLKKNHRKFRSKIDKALYIKTKEVSSDEELNQVSDLIIEVFQSAMQRDNFAFTNSTEFIDKLKETIEGGGKIYIATYKNKLAGTISYKPTTVDKWFYTGDAITLKQLAVLEKYQKHGIGKILVDIIKQAAAEKNLPIVLNTPEANKRAIKFYQNNGFSLVRLLKSSDHFAVQFFDRNTPDKISEETCQAVFENTAFNTMLKHYDLGIKFSLECLKEKWDNEFEKFLMNVDDETRHDISLCFRKYGITAKEYFVYNFAEKTPKQRSNYISAKTLQSICDNYKSDSENNNATDRFSDFQKFKNHFAGDFVLIDGKKSYLKYLKDHKTCFVVPNNRNSNSEIFVVNDKKDSNYAREVYKNNDIDNNYIIRNFKNIDKSMKDYVNNYVVSINIITLKTSDSITPVFGTMNFHKKASAIYTQSKPHSFASLNVEKGTVSLNTYRTGDSSYRIQNRDANLEINYRKIPKWSELLDCATSLAKELPEALIGWEFVYINGEWKFIDFSRTPDLQNIQIAKQKGLRPAIEEILNEPINTRITIK